MNMRAQLQCQCDVKLCSLRLQTPCIYTNKHTYEETSPYISLFVRLSVVSVMGVHLMGRRRAMFYKNLRGWIKILVNQKMHEIWLVDYQEIH